MPPQERRTPGRQTGCDQKRKGKQIAHDSSAGDDISATERRGDIVSQVTEWRGQGPDRHFLTTWGLLVRAKKHALSALCPFSSRPSSRFFRPGDNGKRIARRTESGSGSRSQKHSMPAKPPEFRNNRQSLFLHDIDFKNFF